MPPGMQVGLGPGHILLDGDPAPPPQKGAERPQFSAHSCCGQMAGRIKMPLGREVGPKKRHCVRYGPLSPLPPKGPSLPQVFGPCLLWSNGWMDEDSTWCGSRPQLWPHCVRNKQHLYILWPPCVADAEIIFLSCFFLLCSFFPRLISAVYHTLTHDVVLVRI